MIHNEYNDIQTKIHELEKLAESVLQLKRSAIPRRPIVIEFCGSPKSGKSCCINSLDLFLRRNKFRTKILTERASVCPVYNKYDPYFNIWTVLSCIAELSVVLSNQPKDYDIILIDRGIFDALCWFTWLSKHDHFDYKNYKSIVSFLTMSRWRSIIDLIYVFIAEPDISLDREYANLLTRKTGSIMKPEVLESYKTAIETTSKEFSVMFKKVAQFDTSKKELNEVNYEVTKSILDILHESTSESICYLSYDDLDQSLPNYFSYSDSFPFKASLNFGARSLVEADDDKVQPLPILVITNKNRDKVFVVKKNKKLTSERSPESGRLLIYLGGHVREEDSIHVTGDKLDLLSLTRYALHREIKEETGIDFFPSKDEVNPLCIWIRSNDRSRKHLAICYIMEANLDAIKFRLDTNEFITTGRTKSGKVFEIDEIYKQYNDLEDWSQIILKTIFNFKPPSEQVPLFDR